MLGNFKEKLEVDHMVSICRCCTYISQLERVHFSSGVGDLSSHVTPPSSLRINSDIPSPMSESSSISDYLSGELSPNGTGVVRQNSENGSDHAPSNGGLLTPADASRAIYALSAAVDRLFEHAANTLHLEGLLSFLEALVYASKTQLFGTVVDRSSNSPGGGVPASTNGQTPSFSTTLHLYRLADVILRSAHNTSRPLLHLMRAWAVIAPHFVEVCVRENQFRFTCLSSSSSVNYATSLPLGTLWRDSSITELCLVRRFS